jgi:tRNA A-37 threonylcarbamoyl transferase component Bud32
MSQPGVPPFDGAAAVAGTRAGELVAGKYRVEHVLGEGGMATVYAGTHVQLREPVALKFLKPEMAKREMLVQRFVREARAAARIKSENVARVVDVGTLPTGEPFMVMELLSGQDLRRVVASRGPLPIEDAVGYILQACDAIAEAHLYGIVHRDLKPANLFLAHRADGSPLVKVLDFGISKMLEEVDENLTATTDVLGSPLYMSPEQIRSPRDVDHRTDIWALGAVLYKMLTGRAAFHADTASASLAKIISDPPPPIRATRPDVPPELEAVILRCLEKDLRARIQQVADLARALLPFVPGYAGEGGTGSVSRARRWAERSGVDHSVAGAAFTDRPLAPAPRGASRGLVLAGALGAAALGVGLCVILLRGPAAPAAAATSSASPPPAPSSSQAPAPPVTAPPGSAPSAAADVPTASASASASQAPAVGPRAGVRPLSSAPLRGVPPKGASKTNAFDDRL